MMLERASVVCAICGAANPAPVTHPAQREPAGPPDFDTRPGEPMRSSLASWVQCCASCGYCADDISRAAENIPAFVASDAYREVLNDATVPEPARHFLAFASVLEKVRQPADAGWSALHAAWVCDDRGATGAAMRCRARAIELWKRGKQAGQLFADDMATEFALVTDLHRRMGEFEHAAVTCGEGLELEDVPPAIEAVLRRQMVLIHDRDTAAHSMRELMVTSGGTAG